MAMNASSTESGETSALSAPRLHGDIVNRHDTHQPASLLNDGQPSNFPRLHRFERRAHIVARRARVQRLRNELLHRNLSLGARSSRCGDANVAIRNDPDHVVALVGHGDSSTVSFPHNLCSRGEVRFTAAAFYVSRHQILSLSWMCSFGVAGQFLRVTGVTTHEGARDRPRAAFALGPGDRGRCSIGCSATTLATNMPGCSPQSCARAAP